MVPATALMVRKLAVPWAASAAGMACLWSAAAVLLLVPATAVSPAACVEMSPLVRLMAPLNWMKVRAVVFRTMGSTVERIHALLASVVPSETSVYRPQGPLGPL